MKISKVIKEFFVFIDKHIIKIMFLIPVLLILAGTVNEIQKDKALGYEFHVKVVNKTEKEIQLNKFMIGKETVYSMKKMITDSSFLGREFRIKEKQTVAVEVNNKNLTCNPSYFKNPDESEYRYRFCEIIIFSQSEVECKCYII
jgi:hypothetical protein